MLFLFTIKKYSYISHTSTSSAHLKQWVSYLYFIFVSSSRMEKSFILSTAHYKCLFWFANPCHIHIQICQSSQYFQGKQPNCEAKVLPLLSVNENKAELLTESENHSCSSSGDGWSHKHPQSCWRQKWVHLVSIQVVTDAIFRGVYSVPSCNR